MISVRYELRLRKNFSVEHIKQHSTIRSAHESLLCSTEEVRLEEFVGWRLVSIATRHVTHVDSHTLMTAAETNACEIFVKKILYLSRDVISGPPQNPSHIRSALGRTGDIP